MDTVPKTNMRRIFMAISKLFTSGLLISTLALAACGGGNTVYDSNVDKTKTKQGAIVGGMLGAMAGMMSKGNKVDKRQNALKGAIVGAGLGAVVGNQLDQQEAALRRDMQNDGVIINNTGDRLIVTLPQDILFEVDSTYVAQGLRSDLATLAENLNQYPDSTIRIVGHTDNTGDALYNQDLSERRAEAVASVLRTNGVSAARIRTYGAGEDQPIASNLNAAGRAQNRRVEVVILPTQNG
jgi:outer membrane protein OmpA-like peptidoglycan-associated protein